MSKNRRKIRQERLPERQPLPRILPAIWIGLVLAVLAAYVHVGGLGFVSYDDPYYVTANAHVKGGLTPANIEYALTSVVDSNWIPVTILSHMAVCEFFGLESGAHHWVNVLLHALAAVVLFGVLHRSTGAIWPSAFVAGVFALHPLHVESVAWVTERKDVLSALLWFLALYAYVLYAERPGTRRYLMVAGLFSLGLMAKPMLVTLPFTLLLFDVWPLRRAEFPRTLWEKVPLFALSMGSSVVTYFVQRAAGTVQSGPLGTNVMNALVSYVSYIGQMFWPTKLAVLYPYRQSLTMWQAAAAAVVLLAVSGAAAIAWRTRPYFATGWFWYLGTLVPVIGIVQVGAQSHADRYMYVPMIGLTIVLAWGALEVVRKWPRTKMGVASAAVAACAACLASAQAQTEYWRNDETLFQHAIDVTENNHVAQIDLANYLVQAGRGAEAIPHYEAALRIRPDIAIAHFNLGFAFARMPGREMDALGQYEQAIRYDPNFAGSHKNLGVLLLQLGRTNDAIVQFEAAQRIQPDPELPPLIARLKASAK